MTEDRNALRAELAGLVRAARELCEWQEVCGASGLPPSTAASDSGSAEPILRQERSETAHAPPRREERREEAEPRPVERAAPLEREAPPLPRWEPAAAAPAPTASAEIRIVESPVLGPEERIRRLAVIAETVSRCRLCGLAEHRNKTVFARGDPSSELVFVGEGPGADEDAQGEPFVGKAGQLLDQMIGAMGFKRDEVYICNVVKCRPPQNRNPEPAEMKACMPYLTEQLDLVRPKVMVTLGNIPLKALFGIEGITRLRGTWKLYRGTVPVMPTYHPSYVLRSYTPKVRGEVWNDLREVVKQLGRELPKKS